MTWTYVPTALAAGNAQTPPTQAALKDTVRLLIGDTIATKPIFQDEELFQFLAMRPTVYGASNLACLAAAAQYSALVSEAAGDRRKDYSDMAKAFRAAAAQYAIMASVAGGGVPYAGGISISDKLLDRENDDSVQPAFSEGMDDNTLPIGPAGPVGIDYGGGNSG